MSDRHIELVALTDAIRKNVEGQQAILAELKALNANVSRLVEEQRRTTTQVEVLSGVRRFTPAERDWLNKARQEGPRH